MRTDENRSYLDLNSIALSPEFLKRSLEPASMQSPAVSLPTGLSRSPPPSYSPPTSFTRGPPSESFNIVLHDYDDSNACTIIYTQEFRTYQRVVPSIHASSDSHGRAAEYSSPVWTARATTPLPPTDNREFISLMQDYDRRVPCPRVFGHSNFGPLSQELQSCRGSHLRRPTPPTLREGGWISTSPQLIRSSLLSERPDTEQLTVQPLRLVPYLAICLKHLFELYYECNGTFIS
ncbi:hypothetical protein NMY22_g4681 [Coprinellus aureogranulatus]|nr:hypothetical protein NMY22_g4681 [Coprinellus aureogranulatus]